MQNWSGTGPNRAVFVVDWDEPSPDSILAWGYRFSGSATSEDMLLAAAAADPRLFLRLGSPGSFGTPVYGIGYDRDQDGFALSDGTLFQDGVAYTGPSDGATAVDPDDSYQEGWFDGSWSYFVGARSVPSCERDWQAAGTGISSRILQQGDWDGFRFSLGDIAPPRASPGDFCRRGRYEVAESSPANQNVPESIPWFTTILAAAGLLVALRRNGRLTCGLMLMFVAGSPVMASHFAAQVVSYEQGGGVAGSFSNPLVALGSPTRFSSPDSPFGGPVTPFQAPFAPEELVSIGFGGHLTLAFDRAVMDRPADQWFGADLIVFGNAFYFDQDFPNGIVGGIGVEPGAIEVSQDGDHWYLLQETSDGAFPTMGYQDVLDAFPTVPGNLPTDFHRPVNPAVDPTGFNMAQLIAAYDGSGGGVSLDISQTGLPWIQYIRFTNLNDPASGITPEIDAVSIVPEPRAVIWLVGWMPLLCFGSVRKV